MSYGLLYFLSVLVFCFVAGRIQKAWFPAQDEDGTVTLDLLLMYGASMLSGALLVAALVDGRGGGLKGGLGVFLLLLTVRLAWSRANRAVLAGTAAVALPAALVVAKLACLTTGCCYGKPTDLPLGIAIATSSHDHFPIARHPTQLYDAAAFLLAALCAVYFVRKPTGRAKALLWSVLIMSVGRFANDFARGDLEPLAGTPLTGTQWLGLGGVLVSTTLLFWPRAARAWSNAFVCEPRDATSGAKTPSAILVAIVLILSPFAMLLLGVVGLLRVYNGTPSHSPWPPPVRLWRWFALALAMVAGMAIRLSVNDGEPSAQATLWLITLCGFAILAVLVTGEKRSTRPTALAPQLVGDPDVLEAPEEAGDEGDDDDAPAEGTEREATSTRREHRSRRRRR